MRDDDKRTGTTGTGTLEADTEHRQHDANRDPLTGEPGAHPVGTGVGAAGGAATGAAIGGAVAGPPGALLGAAIGGIAGGFAGKGIAEAVNPTEEEAYWRTNYSTRPYAEGRKYDELAPAYRYGWESRGRYADRTWDQSESDLERGWDSYRGTTSNLGWSDARHATRDAWSRVETNVNDDAYWRENYSSRPYSSGREYDDLRPAYRYGTEARSRYAGRRFEDAEGDLERGWDNFKGKSKMAWHEARDAVRDAFNRDDDHGRGAYGTGMGTSTATGTTGVAGGGNVTLGSGTYTTTTGLTGAQAYHDDYWRSNFSSRPYASGGSYEDYSPAYRYGWESRNRYQGRRYEDVENDLERGWDQARGTSRLGWERVKQAVKDAWHGVERTVPGDADRDGR